MNKKTCIKHHFQALGILSVLIISCSNISRPSTTVMNTPTYENVTPSLITLDTPQIHSSLPAESTKVGDVEFLIENPVCDLPCWWGIRPGLTNRSEAQSVLESLFQETVGDPDYRVVVGEGHFSINPLVDGIRLGMQYISNNDDEVIMIYVITEMLEDVYTKIYNNLAYQEIMSDYTLEAILKKYGKPDKILVRSFSGVAGEVNPTQVLLYYPRYGIVIQYFSPNGLLTKDESFVLPTCPPKSHISLRLFDPSADLGLDEILMLDDSYNRYKDISEVSNMDIDVFYESYREYDEILLKDDCPATLILPESIWPSEYKNP